MHSGVTILGTRHRARRKERGRETQKAHTITFSWGVKNANNCRTNTTNEVDRGKHGRRCGRGRGRGLWLPQLQVSCDTRRSFGHPRGRGVRAVVQGVAGRRGQKWKQKWNYARSRKGREWVWGMGYVKESSEAAQSGGEIWSGVKWMNGWMNKGHRMLYVCVCVCECAFTLVYFGIYECFMADMSGQGLWRRSPSSSSSWPN